MRSTSVPDGSKGYNLIEDTSGCSLPLASTDLTGVDPMLGALGDNGGPTFTQALLAGSPAVSAVPVRRLCRQPDQRGVPRAVPCDIGAYETP